MITILGGELLCALGSGEDKVKALGQGKPSTEKISVNIGGSKITWPYYRLAAGPAPDDSALIDSCLAGIVEPLLQKNNLTPTELENCGVFLGTSSLDYSLARLIEGETRKIPGMDREKGRVGGGNFAASLMRRFGIRGPSLTCNTACTSSANALLEAAAMLDGGIIDYALVVGLEIFSPTGIEGFMGLQLLSSQAVRPFDRQRDGLVLGEAVGAVLLSRDDIYPSSWHLLGGRSNCETSSITGADPSGNGIARVIIAALAAAGMKQEDITAIKAHGTGGELMDMAEMRGMELVFSILPPYFSLKPYIGHTLGACGVAELLLLMECVTAGFIPPTLNFHELDSEFRHEPLRQSMELDNGCFMLNYFGFGGNNTSFIIEKT